MYEGMWEVVLGLALFGLLGGFAGWSVGRNAPQPHRQWLIARGVVLIVGPLMAVTTVWHFMPFLVREFLACGSALLFGAVGWREGRLVGPTARALGVAVPGLQVDIALATRTPVAWIAASVALLALGIASSLGARALEPDKKDAT